MVKNKKFISIRFNFKSFHPKLFSKIYSKIDQKAKLLNITLSKPISLPKKIRRFTVLRSPHVNKTARDQFEIITHHKMLESLFCYDSNMDKKKAKIFINFIKNLCGGMQLKVTYNTVLKRI